MVSLLASMRRRRSHTHIAQAEVFERSIKGLLDIVGVMRVVPELGGDEKLLARYTRFLDGITNSRLGSVNTRGINVAVASLEGSSDSTVQN